MNKVVQATTKGQITLPANWRNNFSTNQYLLKQKGDSLVISPIDVEKMSEEKEYTVFDAIRDNKGKGIKATELAKVLEEMD